MPANPREVFDFLTKESGEEHPQEVNLLAYGAFAAELYEWVEHEEHRQGRSPTEDEVNAWIAQLPDNRLRRIRDEALESFGLAAKEFLRPEVERQRREAVERSILAEVRRFTGGLRSFGLNVAAGLVAAVIFAALALGFYYYVKADPSPLGQTRELLEPPQR